ncbi:MAG TPA: hypothetical protein VN841_29095 [Bryobacteraceae bacterium]|nr:hypothetical protein [Bryobacteraceae bacterium]
MPSATYRDLTERVAVLEESKHFTGRRLDSIEKKLNWLNTGIIIVLLNAVATLLLLVAKRG